MEQNPNAWPNTITTTFGVAWAELQMNKCARGRVISFREVIEQLTQYDHDLDPKASAREFLRCETGIAEAFGRQGKCQEVIDPLEEVIKCQGDMSTGGSSEDTDTLDSGVMFAKAHYDLGNYQKAATLFSELHETLKRPEVMRVFPILICPKLMQVSHSRGTAWRLGLALRAKVLGTLGARYIER